MRLKRFALTGYAVGLLAGVGLIATYGAMEVSSTPAFCGSCHIMEPYYLSWRDSSHGKVACVECHIPPGITAEFRKKYEALSMVTRYFTGTYSTNPWTEVEDSACLECHERRLLVGAEVFGGVLFDHGPHLTELRRGKRLRCTSCHSQIVQGSHITVTATTCTLCHFKNQPAATGTAECTLCHQVPQGVVDAEGVAFDHSQVARFGMECLACHPPPPPGSGGVPRERCVTCHNEPERLAEYDDGDLLHRTHVTDHKVECTNCHLEIEHVAPRHLEATRTECGACHGGRHAKQRELYAGLGGRDVEPMPSAMYQAGVRCEGCHLSHGGGDTSVADEVSCMSCHGPGYRALFHSWVDTVESRVAGLRRQLGGTQRAVRDSESLADASANLSLVEQGHGVHNVPYSLAVLGAAHRQMNEARRTAGLGALAPPWPVAPYESQCFDCHAGAESSVARVFGRRFPHQPHVVAQGMECESCHSTHEEREAGAPALSLSGAAACNACHHRDTAAECASCHRGLDEGSLPVTEHGDFRHGPHVEDMELACSDCHGEPPGLRRKPDAAVCSDCH